MKHGLPTRVDSVIEDALSSNRIVGAVVLISLDGSIVYHRPAGGGGMLGTGEDFLRFLETIRVGGHPILQAESVGMMTQNQIGSLWVVGDEPGWKFGFGAAVLEDPAAADSPQSQGTISWGGAWGHHWFVDLARQLTVVSLTNTGGLLGDIWSQEAIYGLPGSDILV